MKVRPGQYVRNGTIIRFTWGDKISAGLKSPQNRARRARKYGMRSCEKCGKEYAPYSAQQRFCSPPCYIKRYTVRKGYQTFKDPIGKRAHTLSQSLVGLARKAAIVEDMLHDALGQPCPYCGMRLEMHNISLDHKQPLHWRLRTQLTMLVLNQRDNLHMICKDCNTRKGNIPHEKYLKLLAFLGTDPELHALIMSRLGHTAGFWRLTNKAQRAKSQ